MSDTLSWPPSRVAILAGGQGTRLATRAGNLPKPMVQVAGRPLLEHQIRLCKAHGLVDIALLVHHRHEVIVDHFGDGGAFGVRIRYLVEHTPRGTAGALHDALHCLDQRFLLMYGDTYLDVDLQRLWAVHLASGAAATLFLHPNDHPQDSDLVDLDASGRVRAILPYPHPPGLAARNLVNAALYVLERDGLAEVTPSAGKSDIAKQMFPAMLAAGAHLHGHVSPEYIKDMGTPERLDKVERDVESGLVARLSSRQLRSAVFLDRDGTLNQEVGHLRSPDQLVLLDGVGPAVRRLNRDGRLAVVVTNQPVLARGDVTAEQLAAIHARLESLLGEQGAFLDRIYHCPHHPEKGHPGEVTALKRVCACRKPAPGMLDDACRDLQIDRAESWLVGDSTADIEAARNAGVRSVLVRTGHAGRDDKHVLRADYVEPDLAHAVDWILHGHAAARLSLLPVAQRAAQGVRLVLVGGLARSGKSAAAQVLKELLAFLGRRAHVVALDGWLLPATKRSEGAGVLSRYDMVSATATLLGCAAERHRVDLQVPVYDRLARAPRLRPLQHSVGVDDVLVVEGVPALLVPTLREWPGALRVNAVASDADRQARLAADYRWRGLTGAALEALLASRELDEMAAVQAAAKHADCTVTLGTTP